MSVKPYTSDSAALTAAATVQGAAVKTLTTRVIKAATATNTTAAPVSLTVYLVPNAGAPAPENTIISAYPIAAGESYPCPELINQGMNAGGTVQAMGLGLNFKYTATDFV